MGEDKRGFRKYLGLTFLIGFGFFTMGLMDPLYDTYVPIFLGRYLSSNALIGIIMTIDNIFAIFLIPIVSVWSDNTRTSIGRRMPFIVVLLPLTAIAFSALPYSGYSSLGALIAVIFALNLFKQSARGPVVALMPDTIPGEFRSEANGVINTMGGIGTILGTIALARLMNLKISLPILGTTENKLPFPVAGLCVIVATILVFGFVREKSAAESAAEEKVPLVESIKGIAGQRDKSALWILLSLFFWFLGYQGVLPFLGKYVLESGIASSTGVAALPAGMVGIAYALFAIPSGYIAHKIGRRKAIRASLVALVAITLVLFAFGPLTAALSSGLRFAAFLVLMFAFGAFWVTVITNSFPMLWQMATFGTIGIYTGLYYTFSQLAAIAAPPITGGLIDSIGYPGIFAFAAACMLAAFFFMGKATGGEPGEPPAGGAMRINERTEA
jgi:maltose/moltooligosaccharide transporter